MNLPTSDDSGSDAQPRNARRPRNDHPTEDSLITPSMIPPVSSTDVYATRPEESPYVFPTFSPLPPTPRDETISAHTWTNTSTEGVTFSNLKESSSSLRVSTQLLTVEPGVCIGHGIDAAVDGILSTIVLSAVVGLLLWLLFAFIRPRFRQVYGVREWFVHHELRPKSLQTGFWSFLFPSMPLIPSLSPAYRGSLASDTWKFPPDEELSQRTLWFFFIIVAWWSVVGLAGALPIYLVTTPCIAQSVSPPQLSGTYSILQDLSLLRLLQLLDNRNITTSFSTDADVRAVLNGTDVFWRTRIRVIVLAVLLIVVAILPALWVLLREFNNLWGARRIWTDVHLKGIEMGWLSIREAPGFLGLGEKTVKAFITKTGLSSTLGESNGNGNGASNGRSRRADQEEWGHEDPEEGLAEVDIQGLFTIGETRHIDMLIEERDTILAKLEVAEAKYVSSFRLSTPDPSIVDLIPTSATDSEGLSHISRPRPLAGGVQVTYARRGRRYKTQTSPSSHAPTSYVAPSQYYKLGSPRSANGGWLADDTMSFSDSVKQRVVGTRFQEINDYPYALTPLPIGSPLHLDYGLSSRDPTDTATASPLVESRQHTPNDDYNETDVEPESSTGYEQRDMSLHALSPMDISSATPAEDWVDLASEPPIDRRHADSPPSDAPDTTTGDTHWTWGRRPKIFGPPPTSQRDTFPLRGRRPASAGSDVAPLHLRLQARPPFVCPQTGVDHDVLGRVYADIRAWRARLKALNQQIADAQGYAYADVAEGARVRGWLLVGRGLRFVPGVQLVEGRAKEDVRWDALQGEGGLLLSQIGFATIVGMVALLLAVGLTAAVGLALADAPDFAHYFPFLQPLANHDGLVTGLATVLAPAAAVTLFIVLAVGAIHYCSRMVGTISISAAQLLVFKTVFYLLTGIGGVWLVAVGAILYAFGALSTSTRRSEAVADGAIYIAILVLAVVILVAVAAPALLLLQPIRLWRVRRALRKAVTPRQQFRAMYPRAYDSVFALGCSVLAVFYASAFSLIFPLVAPAAALLVFLTLLAHRFLVGYVYARTNAPTGGLLQLWLLKRLAGALALQPLLLGLVLLSRGLYPEGGVLVGLAGALLAFVEAYTALRTRRRPAAALSAVTQHALQTLADAAQNDGVAVRGGSPGAPPSDGRTRGSMASVLDLLTHTLETVPSPSEQRGPIPLATEALDDRTATARAARTHPGAPPHLPPLPFAGGAGGELGGVLYAPAMTAPPAVLWLPADDAGVARSEAHDLQVHHGLQATVTEDGRACAGEERVVEVRVARVDSA